MKNIKKNRKSNQKYAVIQRSIMNSCFMIRFLDNGNTEIMESVEDYYPEDVKKTFTYSENEYFWNTWASKSLWKKVWIEDEQENGDDVRITYFEDFNIAYDFLETEIENPTHTSVLAEQLKKI